jgi:hypothetical protein
MIRQITPGIIAGSGRNIGFFALLFTVPFFGKMERLYNKRKILTRAG